jgi:hypothetical protein
MSVSPQKISAAKIITCGNDEILIVQVHNPTYDAIVMNVKMREIRKISYTPVVPGQNPSSGDIPALKDIDVLERSGQIVYTGIHNKVHVAGPYLIWRENFHVVVANSAATTVKRIPASKRDKMIMYPGFGYSFTTEDKKTQFYDNDFNETHKINDTDLLENRYIYSWNGYIPIHGRFVNVISGSVERQILIRRFGRYEIVANWSGSNPEFYWQESANSDRTCVACDDIIIDRYAAIPCGCAKMCHQCLKTATAESKPCAACNQKFSSCIKLNM